MSEPGPKAGVWHGRAGSRTHPRRIEHGWAGTGRRERDVTISGSRAYVEDGA